MLPSMISLWSEGMENLSVILIVLGLFILPVLPQLISMCFGKNSEVNRNQTMPSRNQLVVRLNDHNITDDNGNLFPTKVIEGKNYFPITESMNVSFVTHVYDNTGGERLPVYSLLGDFTKINSQEFEFKKYFGRLTPNHKLTDWSTLGLIPLDFLVPPFSGYRNLTAVIEIVRSDSSGLGAEMYFDRYWRKELLFNYNFTKKGYKEITADLNRGRLLALQLGVAVAWSDGQYEEREGKVLETWIQNIIKASSDKEKKEYGKKYSDAINEASIEIRDGTLSLSKITQELNRIGDESIKYQAIDLCFKILAADGRAAPAEVALVTNIADALNLDFDRVVQIKDHAILNLEMSIDSSPDIEELIGIQKCWDNETKKKFLRKEFQKWNNRLSVVSEGTEKNNAQHMLDIIAEARKKYD